MSTSTERMRRLRERRAASLMPAEPVPGVMAVPDLVRMAPAVDGAVAALKPRPEDGALVALARLTAQLLDQAANEPLALVKLGPLLLKTLCVLDGKRVPAKPPRPPSRVAQLRAAVADDMTRNGRRHSDGS